MKGLFLSKDFRKGKVALRGGGRPYVSELCRIARIKVWIVDGEYIRKNICEDFVNYDHHYRLEFIPKKEFWISKDCDPEEHSYYIDRMFMEHRLIESGMSYNAAVSKAALFERKERAKSAAMKALSGVRSDDAKLIKKVHIKELPRFSGSVKVWLIDGTLVRSLFYTDFGGGGHDRVYDFIPPGEIWIDDDISPRERKFIAIHEMHERNLMSRGLKYPQAHLSATEVEDHFRHYPKRIDDAIKKIITDQDGQASKAEEKGNK